MAGTLRALTKQHFEHMRKRVTQVLFATVTHLWHGCLVPVGWPRLEILPDVLYEAVEALALSEAGESNRQKCVKSHELVIYLSGERRVTVASSLAKFVYTEHCR